MEINLQSLIDDARCYEAVRDLRWPEKTCCPKPDVKLSGEVECDEVYVSRGAQR